MTILFYLVLKPEETKKHIAQVWDRQPILINWLQVDRTHFGHVTGGEQCCPQVEGSDSSTAGEGAEHGEERSGSTCRAGQASSPGNCVLAAMPTVNIAQYSTHTPLFIQTGILSVVTVPRNYC